MAETLNLKSAQEKRMKLAKEIQETAKQGSENGWTEELETRFNEQESDFKEVEEVLAKLNHEKDLATRASAIADRLQDSANVSASQAQDITHRSTTGAIEKALGGDGASLEVSGRNRDRELRNYVRTGDIADEVIKETRSALSGCPVAEISGGNGYALRFGANPMSEEIRSDIMKHRCITPETRSGMLEAERFYLENLGLETRDMGSEQPGFGLEWVAPQMLSFVEATLIEVGNLRSRATVIRTDGAGELRIPLSDDTSNVGEIVIENQATNSEDVPTANVILGKFQYSSKMIPVHNSLLADPSVNSEFYIGRAAGIRVARIQNLHFTAGDGVAKPRGVLTDATDSGVTLAGVSTISYDNVIDVFHALDPSYRVMANWELNDLTIAAIKKITDSQGQPLWMPGLVPGAPSTILGRPYFSNPDMPAPAASANSMLFGDMSKYYIRDMRNAFFTRSEHFLFNKNQTAFILWMFSDGALVEPTAAVYATQAAT